VHCHPDRQFAGAHLASGYGKTEAWIVIATAGDAHIHLGFKEPLDPERLAGWVAGQHIRHAASGDKPCPGRPRRDGARASQSAARHRRGVFIVELQEPTDYSVLLEWQGFRVDPEAGHLGLGWQLALACVDRSAWPAERLEHLRNARRPQIRNYQYAA
jgi:mannose-6-phosphate isomerase